MTEQFAGLSVSVTERKKTFNPACFVYYSVLLLHSCSPEFTCDANLQVSVQVTLR